MPRKTTILIVVLAAITGLLIFLAVRNESGPSQNSSNTSTPQPTAVEPYATLGFSKSVLDLSNLPSNQVVDIVIDSSEKPVAGAQIELSYDPGVISNVKLLPAENPYFGKDATVLINTVDQALGRISYAVGLGAGGVERSGSGVVVRLSFNANKNVGVQSTQFKFLDKSAVTTWSAPQSSILKSTTPLQIIILSSTPIAN